MAHVNLARLGLRGVARHLAASWAGPLDSRCDVACASRLSYGGTKDIGSRRV